MAKNLLVIGESGSGKSSSIRNLDSNKTFIIQSIPKDLPFAGSRSKYTPFKIDQAKGTHSGNLYVSDNYVNIIKVMKYVSSKMPEIKYIIIDDLQFIMSNEFFKRANEKGYEKFTDIAQHIWYVISESVKLRDDLTNVYLTHAEEGEDSKDRKVTQMKSIGRMFRQYATPEGWFDIVLVADKIVNEDDKLRHVFITNDNSSSVAKSPPDMFSDRLVDNDLELVLSSIEKYYKQ